MPHITPEYKEVFTSFLGRLKIVISSYQILIQVCVVVSDNFFIFQHCLTTIFMFSLYPFQMPVSLKITFPPAFTNALNALKLLNFDFVKFTPVECVKRINFVESLYITTLAPIISLFLIIAMYLIHVYIITNCCCMLKSCQARKRDYFEQVEVEDYEPVRGNDDEIQYGDDGHMKLQPVVLRDKTGSPVLDPKTKEPVLQRTEGVASGEKFRRTFVINPLWPSYLYGILYISAMILPGITCKIFQMFVCYDIGMS